MNRMFRQRKPLLYLFVILTTLTIIGCSEEICNPDITEDQVIGTWVLTKIIASYPIGSKEVNPEEESLSVTIIVSSDRTFRQNQVLKGETTSINGTWSVSGSSLNVVSPSGTFTFPCRIDGNTLQVASTIKDPDSGTPLPVTLKFTKQ